MMNMNGNNNPKEVTTMTHAESQLRTRLTEIGFDAKTVNMVWAITQERARTSHPESEAVKLLDLDGTYKTADGSQGNEVWAIYRGGKAVTTMLRNAWQSRSPEAMRVSKVSLHV